VFFLYGILISPFAEYEHAPLIITKLFESAPGVAVAVGILCIVLALVVFMYAVRSLWNRIFPKICGWKEIGLTEAYAISMLIGFLTFGL